MVTYSIIAQNIHLLQTQVEFIYYFIKEISWQEDVQYLEKVHLLDITYHTLTTRQKRDSFQTLDQLRSHLKTVQLKELKLLLLHSELWERKLRKLQLTSIPHNGIQTFGSYPKIQKVSRLEKRPKTTYYTKWWVL